MKSNSRIALSSVLSGSGTHLHPTCQQLGESAPVQPRHSAGHRTAAGNSREQWLKELYYRLLAEGKNN